MGFGTFDGLHEGHRAYFKQLGELGDEVWIVVARDSSVQKAKGKRALLTEQDRLKAVQESGLVHGAILGHSTDFYQCIRDYKPDIIGLGYDQKADLATLEKEFPHIKVIRLKAYRADTYKSSLLNR